MCVYIYTHTHTYIYTHIYIHIYIHTYRVSIKSFPDYIYYKKTTVRGIQTCIFFSKCNSSFFYNISVHFNMCSFCCTDNV